MFSGGLGSEKIKGRGLNIEAAVAAFLLGGMICIDSFRLRFLIRFYFYNYHRNHLDCGIEKLGHA
ncbi:hypothetical protein Sbal678_2029 [Shewanella baltica OS678]|nr:hypothetical protein Sbal678_2029 [Shewanella baltica OS678]